MFSPKFILITLSLSYVVALHNSNPTGAFMGTKDETTLIQPAQEEDMFRRSLASIEDVERTLESVLELVHLFRIMYPKKSVIVQQSVYEMYDPQTKRTFGEAFDALEHVLMIRENRIKLRSIFSDLLDNVKSGGPSVPQKQDGIAKQITSIPVVSAGNMPSDSNVSKVQGEILKPVPSVLEVKDNNKLRDSNAIKVQGAILKPRPSILENKDREKLRHSNAFKTQGGVAKQTSPPVIKSGSTAKLAASSQVNSTEIKKLMARTQGPVSPTLKTKRSATSAAVKERKPATAAVTENQKLINPPTVVDRERKKKSAASEYDLLAKFDPAEIQRKFEMASAMLQEALAKDEYLRLDNFEATKLGNRISKQKKRSMNPVESTPIKISSSRVSLDKNSSNSGYQRNRNNNLNGFKSTSI